VYTGMRGTFVTERRNVDVNLRGRLTRKCVLAVMGSGALVDRVKLNSTRNRPRTMLEGVPSRHERC